MKKSRNVSKAMILAAGYGTRMSPLSSSTPKALMPFCNRPLLYRALDLMQDWGVRDVLINAHHHTDQVWDAVRAYPSRALRLSVSHEPEILGTGGALRKAAWFFDEEPFWLINADLAIKTRPEPLIEALRPPRTIAALWMTRERGPLSVQCKKGYIRDFAAPKGTDTYTFCGLHLVAPEILNYISLAGPFSIIDAYRAAMRDGWRVAGTEVKGSVWYDLGTPAQYLEAHRAFGCAVSVSPSARVARSARLENTVVWDGANVAAHVHIKNAIIGTHANVTTGTENSVLVRATDSLSPTEMKTLTAQGWHPERTTATFTPPRGSARTFIRVQEGKKRAMLVRYNPARVENSHYAQHTQFLHQLGVRVPALLHHEGTEHWGLWEDAGNQSLEDLFRAPSARWKRVYMEVLGNVATLHTRGLEEAKRRGLPLSRPFGPKLYTWEHELFLTEFVTPHLHPSPAELTTIRKELAQVSRALKRCPHVLLHRDLQSSNVLIRKGHPCLIDFQGMRAGPAVYDIASLMADPYVSLPAPFVQEWITAYADQTGTGSATADLLPFAMIQRLAQALGAYGRLSKLPGNERFATFIPVALARLASAAASAGHFSALEHLPNT